MFSSVYAMHLTARIWVHVFSSFGSPGAEFEHVLENNVEFSRDLSSCVHDRKVVKCRIKPRILIL